jgi:hypothetical protein
MRDRVMRDALWVTAFVTASLLWFSTDEGALSQLQHIYQGNVFPVVCLLEDKRPTGG